MVWDTPHPYKQCVLVHHALGPDQVVVGKETDVTHCLCCMSNAAERQKLKWKEHLCAQCKEKSKQPNS